VAESDLRGSDQPHGPDQDSPLGPMSIRMRALRLLLHPTAPPLALGLVIVPLLLAAETGLVYALMRVTGGSVFGVVFLLGILVVSTVWGLRLGALTTLASTVVYVLFHRLQTGGSILAATVSDTVAVGVFLVVALSAATLAGLARLRAREADRRRREVEVSHDELGVLAEHQAALRRVATLVARGAVPSEVFAAVSDELARCLRAVNAGLLRYEPDGSGYVVDVQYELGITNMPVPGERISLAGDEVGALVLRTGRVARIDNHDGVSGPEAERIRDAGIGSIVGAPIVIDGHLWGAAIIGTTQREPLSLDAEARLCDFTDLVATAIGNAQTRADLRVLAEQQAALRRIATLVARYTPPAEVFAAVADEMARCLGTTDAEVSRYDPDNSVVVVAAHVAPGARGLTVGERLTLDGDSVAARVSRTGRPARMDSYEYETAAGTIAARTRELGQRSRAGAPIVVDGKLWGLALVGASEPEQLPSDIEERIAEFADLVATAIANTATRLQLHASQSELRTLAEQQAGLRRVATLVAREIHPSDVFDAVVDEMRRCMDAMTAGLWRFETSDELTLLSGAAADPSLLAKWPVGTRTPVQGNTLASRVQQTGRPARMDDYENVSGAVAKLVRNVGVRAAVGIPIVVNGVLWGLAAVGSMNPGPLPPDTEARMADFGDLVATSIANAATREELLASRARIVVAADEARRRIERDLHDGAQQRLVALGLELRVAQAKVPEELQPLRDEISGMVGAVGGVLAEVQEISRGLHPAVLSRGGLTPALKALARRCTVPVGVDVHVDHRLPDQVEVGAYYVVAEALTNAAKHARASAIDVRAQATGGSLRLEIRDDGIGGAARGKGSGLTGLVDRVEALGGTITIKSPSGRGTSLLVDIPIESD
jgi:signal transduction histidine kinase